MANLYDLKKFDLNLLVIFECIYQHLSRIIIYNPLCC